MEIQPKSNIVLACASQFFWHIFSLMIKNCFGSCVIVIGNFGKPSQRKSYYKCLIHWNISPNEAHNKYSSCDNLQNDHWAWFSSMKKKHTAFFFSHRYYNPCCFLLFFIANTFSLRFFILISLWQWKVQPFVNFWTS